MRDSEHAFNLLHSASPTLGKIRVIESAVTVPAGPVLHGLDEEELIHLLVPLSEDQTPQSDRRSAGVQMSPTTLQPDEGEASRFLDVICQLPHLNSLFYDVANDMLEEIQNHRDSAPGACQNVLDQWRELLNTAPRQPLGREKLVGLLGELLVLQRISAYDPVAALDCWTGPEGHRFDFMGQHNALEVKTTLAREGRSIEIHGLEQLDPPENSQLHLQFFRFEPASADISIPGLIKQLIHAGVHKLKLYTMLLKVGLHPADISFYDDSYFSLKEELTYLVDDSFPRIIPTTFSSPGPPERVSHIRYRADLSGPEPSPLDDNASLLILKQLVSDS